MKDTKSDAVKNFMDKLKTKPTNGNELLINTRATDFSQYSNIFVFKTSICRKCNGMTQVKGVVVYESLTKMIVWCEKQHELYVLDKGVLCSEPDLLIVYDTGLMLTASLSARNKG